MTTKVIEMKVLPKEFEKFGKKTIEEYKEAAIKGVKNYLPNLVADSPVDTGEYANSWDTEERPDMLILGNFAPHAPIIELGARPFKPPIKPLLDWAKRVLKDSSQPPNYSNRVKSLAYATQKKIQEEGMEPKHILKNSIKNILEEMRMELMAMEQLEAEL